ncbi:MAG: helix-turn-helix transcriptional regulator [Rhizobiales bacterium]|nr:helix-turn-helix transcriptional regulator [Hyphomicrobiales bacterium]
MKNKIKDLRSDHKLSQAELGSKVGVSRQAINAVETEKHVPSLTLAFKIADVFGLQIEEVFFPQKE